MKNAKSRTASILLVIAAAVPAKADPAVDWRGVHATLTFGITTNGDVRSTLSSPTEGTTPVGGQLGYRVQRDAIVLGGDLGFYQLDDDSTAVPSSFMGPITEARLTLGYAEGYALYYGALGYATGTFDDTVRDFSMGGISLGLGVDYAIAEGWSIGGEVMRRSLTGRDSGATLEYDHTALQLRLGYRF
jgi:opacity protein-like surface antigen